MKEIRIPYNTKNIPIVLRLSIMFLLIAAFTTGLLQRWDAFGLSLGVLLIVIIVVCNIRLTIRMDQRFDRLEELIESKGDKPKTSKNNK